MLRMYPFCGMRIGEVWYEEKSTTIRDLFPPNSQLLLLTNSTISARSSHAPRIVERK